MGGKSVYIPIRRGTGAAEDTDGISNTTRKCLLKMRAVHVETLPCRTDFWLWEDWYRITIYPGKTIADIARSLHAQGLTDGPYFGIGRDRPFAVGSGVDNKAAKMRSAARERGRQVARFNRQELPYFTIFKSNELTTMIQALAYHQEQDNSCPSSWVEDLFTRQQWEKFVARYPLFPGLWRVITDLYAMDGPTRTQLEYTIATSLMVRLLEWCRAHPYTKEPVIKKTSSQSDKWQIGDKVDENLLNNVLPDGLQAE